MGYHTLSNFPSQGGGEIICKSRGGYQSSREITRGWVAIMVQDTNLIMSTIFLAKGLSGRNSWETHPVATSDYKPQFFGFYLRIDVKFHWDSLILCLSHVAYSMPCYYVLVHYIAFLHL